MPYYSFVILCYNNWEISQQAIDSLIKSLSDKYKAKGIELIIVNNGATDETADGIKNLKTKYKDNPIEIIDIHLEENMGYPVGLNLGLAKCRGKIITTLNNDLIFPPDWFDGLSDTLENNKKVGLAVPHLSYASGPQNVGVKLKSQKEINNFAKKFMKNNKQKIVYPLRVIGACLSFKRRLLNRIGGNDFWFGIGVFDDDDISLRTIIAGYKLAVVGSSFVYHIGNVSLHQKTEQVSAAMPLNGKKFQLKWNLKPYGDRQKVINNTPYNKQEHYFPTKIEDFNGSKPVVIDKEENKTRSLLVADWTNNTSNWKQKLSLTLENITQNQEIYLWIPEKYYLKDKALAEIKEVIQSDQLNYINFFYENIPPIDLLKFLNSFDNILNVKDDYINKYISYLAKQISITTI